ncbi:AraC family transcriptional regulator [Sphingomonas crusticola]|uniref:AraC family transcriptional regulator n=1 Tax=Sphingomonas crusticola TaxID=1697973 RepID=UPI000E2585EC|nr:AraC family transcriptional regulator [Sphingomonas crusticola]
MKVAYAELSGELSGRSIEDDATQRAWVIRSNILHGHAVGPQWHGLTLRYVGRGTEHYRIGGRHYRVGDDQFMIAPQQMGSEAEIRRSELKGTLGLCIFLPTGDGAADLLVDAPVILPASCMLGTALRNALQRLSLPAPAIDEPWRVAAEAKRLAAETLLALDDQVEAVAGLKRRTRFEAVRRMNSARAYLHSVTSRPVPLDELALEVAVSPFQLLRSFRDCFGETPASYHRRLRLNLARHAVEGDGHSYAFVADRFGFADGSSFSHAYKRTFGEPPVRRLRPGEAAHA